jgi:hypothetical protein
VKTLERSGKETEAEPSSDHTAGHARRYRSGSAAAFLRARFEDREFVVVAGK